MVKYKVCEKETDKIEQKQSVLMFKRSGDIKRDIMQQNKSKSYVTFQWKLVIRSHSGGIKILHGQIDLIYIHV